MFVTRAKKTLCFDDEGRRIIWGILQSRQPGKNCANYYLHNFNGSCPAGGITFVLLVASSLSDEAALLQQGYGFWPRKFSLFAYEYLFLTNYVVIFRAFGITIFNTVVGTSLSLLIAPMLAYPLSRQDYPRARIVTFLVFSRCSLMAALSRPTSCGHRSFRSKTRFCLYPADLGFQWLLHHTLQIKFCHKYSSS